MWSVSPPSNEGGKVRVCGARRVAPSYPELDVREGGVRDWDANSSLELARAREHPAARSALGGVLRLVREKGVFVFYRVKCFLAN